MATTTTPRKPPPDDDPREVRRRLAGMLADDIAARLRATDDSDADEHAVAAGLLLRLAADLRGMLTGNKSALPDDVVAAVLEPASCDVIPATAPVLPVEAVAEKQAVAAALGTVGEQAAWWLGIAAQAVRNADAGSRASVDRKSSGMFFTPPDLVRPTVRRALRDAGPEALVLDPACGAGAFLVAALDRLGPEALPRVHGIDRDPVAVMAARLALYLATQTPEPAVLRDVIRCEDALTDSPPPTDRYDAILGNPPWETLQSESSEFFVAIDPTYRQLDKRRALERQESLLEDDAIRARWSAYEQEREALRRRLRERYPIASHGKVYTYKYFVEYALRALRPGGRLGMILPSGLYTDDGSAVLRRAIAKQATWEWLFAFENRRRIFPIDSRYKFAAVILRTHSRGDEDDGEDAARSSATRVSFGNVDIAVWDTDSPATIALPPEELAALRSPASLAWPELTDTAQLQALQEIATAGVPLGDVAGLVFRQGINLTTANREAAFEPIDQPPWCHGGFDATGRWRGRGGPREAVWPLLQGAMIHAFEPLYQGWQEGHARGTRWARVADPQLDTPLAPQYVMRESAWRRLQPDLVNPSHRAHRIVFRNTGSSSNERSMIATIAPPIPCGNSAQTLLPAFADLRWSLQLLAVLNSLPFDFALRSRMGSPNLNWHLVREIPIPRRLATELDESLIRLAARLALVHRMYARCWKTLGLRESDLVRDVAARRELRLELDVRIAREYHLTAASIARIARPDRDDPKGFWRVDAALPEQARHPHRWAAAAATS